MKYLYLEKADHAATWQNAGKVPVYLASKYRDRERRGTSTPDETIDQFGNMSGGEAEMITTRIVRLENCNNVLIRNLTTNMLDGERRTGLTLAQTLWDGYVFCLSNTDDRTRCNRLRKVTCVSIDDVDALFASFSQQFGLTGEMRSCHYTPTARRDAFTKSTEDEWQDEFRMFWNVPAGAPHSQERWVTVPRGVARVLW